MFPRRRQDQTVMEIVDEIFNDPAGQGQLTPQWRWSLENGADPAVYPRRSLSVQYQESDLAYVHRLLREEGLFYWWEHEGKGEEGSHTLVIADHNGAFQPNLETLKGNKRQEWLARCHFGTATAAEKYPDVKTHAEQYKLALAG